MKKCHAPCTNTTFPLLADCILLIDFIQPYINSTFGHVLRANLFCRINISAKSSCWHVKSYEEILQNDAHSSDYLFSKQLILPFLINLELDSFLSHPHLIALFCSSLSDSSFRANSILLLTFLTVGSDEGSIP